MKTFIERLFKGGSRRARMAFCCAALAGMAAGASNARAEAISDSALQQISALQAEKDSRSPAQQKMDSQLVYALKQSLNQVIAPGVTNLRVFVPWQADGRVKVDLKATVTSELLAFIQKSGGTIINSLPQFQAVQAVVPLSLTETLAGRSDVQFVRGALPGRTWTGSVDSEGDTTHRAIEARPAFNVNGYGVKVGVLSDSVDYMAQAVSTGDLPSNLTVLPGQSGVPNTGEGTAMLEIIYDLAPGAQLFFATGGPGEAQFAQNILNLRAAGCDIIVDDVYYPDESPFQDGIVAQAVNSVTADGALYFSAAGNEGSLRHGTSGAWEGDFVDGGAAGTPVNGKGGTLHSFGANTYDTATAVGSFTVLLWSDALGASANDYDLYVLDSTGNTVVSSSTTIQNGTQDPFEIVSPPNVGERVVVVLANGAARFLHIRSFGGQLAINTAGSIVGHAGATNAFACAAVDIHTAYPNPFSGGAANPVEYFSSDGPRQVFYNADGTPITPGNFLSTGGYVRLKPDISAADGVSTTLPDYSGLNPFYGTSAAAPHAAAIAALLKSYNPSLTPSQVRAILTSTALDNEAPGYDFNGGYGIVMAYQALQSAPPYLLPILTVVTNVISGGNGNGIIDYNECNDLFLILTNLGRTDATGVRGTLSTTTPGVVVAQTVSTYPNLPAGGGSAANQTPFKLSTSPSFVCGTPIDLTLVIKCDQAAFTNQIRLTTGVLGMPLRFDNSTLVPVPDLGEGDSRVVVSNITSVLGKVTVSLFLTHTYDSDLLIQLISPDGTTSILSANNGPAGQNYGAACGPDSQRTTFDDAATNSITTGTAPFVGTFHPQTPLLVFSGKVGTNVNGIWTLRAVDQYYLDSGAIQCWSLFLTPIACKDGGGECPGANLAIGMTEQPSPVVVGQSMTYSIAVTNFGPSSARSVTVNHQLPSGVLFVTATCSQGGPPSQAGGLVTCYLGTMAVGGTATMTVVGIPTSSGIISSTANVTSSEPDPDPSNNSATVLTQVIPPSADLTVGLTAIPNPVVIDGTLTYTISVTNNGPSDGSGVVVTNALPSGLSVLSATVSQGSITSGGNLWTIGSLAAGHSATATIVAIPTIEGSLAGTSTIQGSQFDPNPANNSATITLVVGPSTDLAIGISDYPDPVVVLSNVTYVVSVTNLGPSAATAVTVNDSLPANILLRSTNVSQGAISLSGNTLAWNVGVLASGAKATLTIVAGTTTNGVLSTSATIVGAQPDPNLVNNTATATTTVAPPGVAIAAAGATLTAESFVPANGAIDVGETVTVVLRLRNSSNVTTLNLVGTLLATDGVTPIAPTSQTYGVLAPSGFPVGRAFTFTATGTNGQTISPTLQLQDGTNAYPPVSFNFTLPTAQVFANTNSIIIPDPAAPHPLYPLQAGPAKPYPSSITVSNLSGVLGKVTVTLSNLGHGYPGDVNVLLVGPSGASTLVMSHAGDLTVTNLNLTFDDSAASRLPDSGKLASGVYQPTAYSPATQLGGFPTNAPAGPYASALSAFNASNPNGVWSLYVFDDAAGDDGAILGGWSLTLSMITPVNQLVDLSLSAASAPNPVLAGSPLTYTFTVANGGPGAATSVAFTNVMPAGLALVSATPSQGIAITNGNTVLANLGPLSTGAVATVTVLTIPTAAVFSPGSNTALLTNTASVGTSETDPNPGNNIAAALTTIIRPVADVKVSQSGTPEPVGIGCPLTNTIVVTNLGPGTAVAVVLTDPLAAGTVLGSANSTVGTCSNSGGIVTCSLGDLTANASATITLVLTNSLPGFMTNTVSVVTGSQDTNSANNTATYIATVVSPAPRIIGAGAVLTHESGPVNALIDPGETVTLSLSLANVGSLDTVNLKATLLASGGVTSPGSPQYYGALVQAGPSAARSFTFTAAAVLTNAVVATLQLQDERPGVTNSLGTVAFTFNLPSASAWSNANFILIPDHGPATPYPATITVSGLLGVVTKATVTLNGLTHGFPHDVNVLLVSPAGGTVLLMSHTGGGYSVTNLTLTFDDAATNTLPNSDRLTSGTNQPSSYPGTVAFPVPAPAMPYGTALVTVAGRDPNGTWSLYVLDDAVGDAGYLAGGWSLGLLTAPALSPLADLAVGMTSAPSSLFLGSALTNTIWVTNFGPASATGVMVTNTLSSGQQVVTNIGSVAVGAAVKTTIVIVPAVTGNITVWASAGGNEVDLNPANNSAQTTATVAVAAPAVLTGFLLNGQMHLTLTAQPGFVYAIQASTDLVSWVSLSTNTVSAAGTIKFTDTSAPGFDERFYRCKRLAP